MDELKPDSTRPEASFPVPDPTGGDDLARVKPSLETLLELRSQNQLELVGRFEQTFSIVRLVPWFVGSILGTIGLGYGLWFVLFYDALSAVAAALLFLYVTSSFGALGILIGVLLVIRQILRNVKDILDSALSMVKDLGTELKSSVAAPESSVVFKKVMQVLIIPSMRAVIAAKLGILHRPVTWSVEKVLARVTSRLIKLVARRSSPKGAAADVPVTAVEAQSSSARPTSRMLATVGQGVDSTTHFVQTAYELVARTSGRIVFFALLPFRILAGLFFLLAFVPLALLGMLL
jgi:hypothetical protein